MLRTLLTAPVAAALLLAAPLAAEAAEVMPAASAGVMPGEVVVHYKPGTSAKVRSAVQREAGTRYEQAVPGGSKRLAIRDGQSVQATVAELRSDPNVAYAHANHLVQAGGFMPNDPGTRLQWNFFGPFGVNAPDAWTLARRAKAPGGRGAVVAVIDSGMAYETRGRFRRAPDFYRSRIVPGRDFVDGDSRPYDTNGHGTHVAGTIVEATNNRRAVSGLAYGAKVMPIRVLDSRGIGNSLGIARAIRYAAGRRVDVINLSIELAGPATARDIPDMLSAIRYAARRGIVIVGSSGNEARSAVNYPAAANDVIAVGATTANGCQAFYSNGGQGLDVAAPGGGGDAPFNDNPSDAQHCRPGTPLPPVFQQTFASERALRSFGLPNTYVGTSFATPHVSATAALLIASRRLGRNPSASSVKRRITQTARDLGPPGYDTRYGAGLLNAAAALSR